MLAESTVVLAPRDNPEPEVTFRIDTLWEVDGSLWDEKGAEALDTRFANLVSTTINGIPIDGEGPASVTVDDHVSYLCDMLGRLSDNLAVARSQVSLERIGGNPKHYTNEQEWEDAFLEAASANGCGLAFAEAVRRACSFGAEKPFHIAEDYIADIAKTGDFVTVLAPWAGTAEQ